MSDLTVRSLEEEGPSESLAYASLALFGMIAVSLFGAFVDRVF
jgi:hypothetical protein